VGYLCVNLDCELNTTKKDENNWSLEKHKDNQGWAVRHLRIAESQIQLLIQENQTLKEQIVGLIQQNLDLATKYQEMDERVKKIENLG
jgi:hypothetical protein